jgi:hypothetical protein
VKSSTGNYLLADTVQMSSPDDGNESPSEDVRGAEATPLLSQRSQPPQASQITTEEGNENGEHDSASMDRDLGLLDWIKKRKSERTAEGAASGEIQPFGSMDLLSAWTDKGRGTRVCLRDRHGALDPQSWHPHANDDPDG